MRSAFDLQARKQYKSHMTEWKKNWRLKKGKPLGLNLGVWEGLQVYWQLDATASIAATNSSNRRSQRGGKGQAIHNGGAKTIEEREIEMVSVINFYLILLTSYTLNWVLILFVF